jgi:hypothetical protein
LLVAARGVERSRLLATGPALLQAALAHYGKRQGMLMVHRDGEGFDVCFAELAEASAAVVDAGRRLFGLLGITSTAPGSLLPVL